MRLTRLTLAVLAVLLAAAALPALADAAGRRGPCLAGQSQPRCDIAYGVVPYQANDGDTVDVRLGGSSALTRIRISGVQAM